jgi:hypothetical protein
MNHAKCVATILFSIIYAIFWVNCIQNRACWRFGGRKLSSKEMAGRGIFGIVSAYRTLNKTFGRNEKLTLFGEVAYLSAPLMGKIY